MRPSAWSEGFGVDSDDDDFVVQARAVSDQTIAIAGFFLRLTVRACHVAFVFCHVFFCVLWVMLFHLDLVLLECAVQMVLRNR